MSFGRLELDRSTSHRYRYRIDFCVVLLDFGSIYFNVPIIVTWKIYFFVSKLIPEVTFGVLSIAKYDIEHSQLVRRSVHKKKKKLSKMKRQTKACVELSFFRGNHELVCSVKSAGSTNDFITEIRILQIC